MPQFDMSSTPTQMYVTFKTLFVPVPVLVALGDETQPACRNCVRLVKTCVWGLKASYHASRTFRLSAADSETLQRIEADRPLPSNLQFIDESGSIKECYVVEDTGDVGAGYKDDIRPPSNTLRSNNEDVQSPVTSKEGQVIVLGSRELTSPSAPTNTVGVAHLSSNRQGRDDQQSSISAQHCYFAIPDQPVYTSRTHYSTLDAHPQPIAETRSSLASPETQKWPINDHIKGRLLSLYLRETSKWCEGTDSLRNFSIGFGHLAKQSSAIAAAAITLAATRDPQFRDHSEWLIDELYQFTIRAIDFYTLENHEVLFANVLLCYYCVYTSRLEELESHLERLRDTIQNCWNGLSDGFTYACFWVVAQLDIWNAYSHSRTTVLPIDSWPVIKQGTGLGSPLQDTYSHKAVWNLARITNELAASSVLFGMNTISELWTECQLWVVEAPQCVRPVMEIEASGESLFPTILFTNPSAVYGNICYHAACILLLNTGKIPDNLLAMSSPACHARRIVGISVTNDEQVNLINSIRPLCIAACHLPNNMEKAGLLDFLAYIEKSTGWKTSEEARKLQMIWKKTVTR